MLRKIIALFAAFALLVCAFPAAAEESVRYTAAKADFDKAFSALLTVGASVAVAKDGEIVGVFNYGRVLGSDKGPIDDETFFKMASASKLITAMGIMQLVDAGKLSLDEDISAYLGYEVRNPNFADVKITIRQILCHTSSIITCKGYTRGVTMTDLKPLQEILCGKSKKSAFSKCAPGTRYEYSNFGFGILGSLIEYASGQTLDDYMTEHIFSPLGIRGVYIRNFLPEGSRIANASYTNGEFYESKDPEYSYIYGAGGLKMSARDLCVLLTVLSGDGTANGVRILSEQTVKDMRVCQTGMEGVSAKVEYGLGMQIKQDTVVKGRLMYGHQGVSNGVIAGLFFDPEDNTCIAVTSNRSKERPEIHNMAPLVLNSVAIAYEYLYGAEE
ncbi:MAG: serine hydrolase [Eubacteriales bacterium]|nr:serine hydrolase [Eubacteriales bacterium]MDD3883038.1 serine hydrolase [Eubacteriales bacterium]MDD4513635.1 serine hydrolase [Eubacteriales bacterium]